MSANRIAKLRRMAEHPTSNPHEAEIARKEMERLLREQPPFADVPDAIFAAMGTSRERYGAERASRWSGVDWDAIERSIAAEIDRKFTGKLAPGDDGYKNWACTRGVGSVVDTRRSDGKTSPGELTVARMTETQYIMSDGSRYRRSGKSPGYKVGEDGSDGNRTYLVKR